MIAALARAWSWATRRGGVPDPGGDASERGELLAAYSAASAAAREADREKRRLRKLVDEIPEGVHGGWRKRFGEPAEILDRDALRELLAARDLTAPVKSAEPPVIVEYVGNQHETRTESD